MSLPGLRGRLAKTGRLQGSERPSGNPAGFVENRQNKACLIVHYADSPRNAKKPWTFHGRRGMNTMRRRRPAASKGQSPERKNAMKKYMLNTGDRKILVNRIGGLAGEKMRYSGMPACSYEGSGFTVGRDGSLLAGEDADAAILQVLLQEGMILPESMDAVGQVAITEETAGEPETVPEETDAEDTSVAGGADEADKAHADEAGPDVTEAEGLRISLPMEGHTPESLRNLINLAYSRGPLLSKAAGGDFGATKEITVAAASAETVEDILLLALEGGLDGIELEEDKVTFTSFPMTGEPEKLAAFQQVACAMAKAAKGQKRIQPKEIATESEKYTFRNWLVRIGMGGPEYKEARQILLAPLSGHTAFRNRAEEEKWKARQKEKRAAAKAGNAADTENTALQAAMGTDPAGME